VGEQESKIVLVNLRMTDECGIEKVKEMEMKGDLQLMKDGKLVDGVRLGPTFRIGHYINCETQHN
jgi:uncharacterized Zn ribbon protein